MLLRGRGISDEVALGIDNAAAEAFLPAANAREHERCREELERAEQRQALVVASADAIGAVKDGDAEPAAMPALQRVKLPRQRELGIIGGRSPAHKGRGG